MDTTSPASTPPALPHWETAPDDVPAAVREVKHAIRARIEASGRSVQEVADAALARITARVDEIVAERERGETVWPVIDYADIAAGTVPAEQSAKLHRRGCVVIRGHFDRRQAAEWDADVVDYVDRNRFFEKYTGPADHFFDTVMSKPEIYPIYWSQAQMQARQSARMATVQTFLNRQWRADSRGARWFDPDRDAVYPDRIRRRPPHTDSGGLGPHTDPGTLELWMTSDYQKAFHHVFDGTVEEYDPWDPAYRTGGPQYPGTTMCSAFRTFQGWTALSDMRHDQGVLHTVPIPEAMAYLLLRPLLDDVADDELCGVALNRTFPVTERYHAALLPALTGLPDIQAGDSVWWHCDMIHSVAPVADQQGWGNVIYIPAAPWCARNREYAPRVLSALRIGASPDDFPAEDYERDWAGRFTVDELNAVGRRGVGLED